MIEPTPEEIAAASAEPPAARRKETYLPDIHRLLPQSADAEQGVLCSILLQPKETLSLCAQACITPEWFHIPAHMDIYRTVVSMNDNGKPIDIVTVTQELRDRQLLDRCGGAAFVTQLFMFLPTAANATYYISIIEEKYTLRQIIRTATEYASRGYNDTEDASQLLEEYERSTLAIGRHRYKAGNITLAKEAVTSAIEQIEHYYEHKGIIGGIRTGFHDLDRKIDGLHKQEMVVFAARPSMGKTALAMGMVEFIAVESRIPVGVFSLEMSTTQLMQRMICGRARVNLARVRAGEIEDFEFPRLTQAASQLGGAAIVFDDQSDMTIQELRGRARRMVQAHGVQAIFVDYLQLIRSSSPRAAENRQIEVAEVSAGLKAMAKELDVAVVVLAQVNRSVDSRGGSGRPRLSDLRESGTIEQDADVVGFITRPEVYAETEEERRDLCGFADLIIAKQRNGEIGDVPLTFIKQFTRFENRFTPCVEEQQPVLGI